MFDMIIITIVLILGLKGLMTGLVKELSSLVGIIGGVLLGSTLGDSMGSFIAPLFGIASNKGSILLGFITSVALFYFISIFAGSFIESIVMKMGLGFADKGLGFVFGAGKIFLIFSIIFYALSNVAFINKKLEEKTTGSLMFPILVKTGSVLITIDFDKLTTQELNTTAVIQQGLKNGH